MLLLLSLLVLLTELNTAFHNFLYKAFETRHDVTSLVLWPLLSCFQSVCPITVLWFWTCCCHQFFPLSDNFVGCSEKAEGKPHHSLQLWKVTVERVMLVSTLWWPTTGYKKMEWSCIRGRSGWTFRKLFFTERFQSGGSTRLDRAQGASAWCS